MTYLTSIYILPRSKKFVEIGLTKMHIHFQLINGLRDQTKIQTPKRSKITETLGKISNTVSVFYIYNG